MLRNLIRQELLVHLMSARFFAAVVITLLLVVANAVVLLEDYERRLVKYSQQANAHREKVQEAKTYSTLKLSIERPPNPLSLFSAGLDKRLGSTFEIYHGSVPMISDGSARSLDNAFLNLFSKIDLVLIFQVVLSLMALPLRLRRNCRRLGKRHLALGYLPPGKARDPPTRQIHWGNGLPAAPRADESPDGNASVIHCQFDPIGWSGFSPDWRDSSDNNHLLIRILSDWTVDFYSYTPHCHITDALYVFVGSFGARLSELESIYPHSRWRYAGNTFISSSTD